MNELFFTWSKSPCNCAAVPTLPALGGPNIGAPLIDRGPAECSRKAELTILPTPAKGSGKCPKDMAEDIPDGTGLV
jgi:hypothetical protein